MINETIVSLALLASTTIASISGNLPALNQPQKPLAVHEMDLSKRLDNEAGSRIFADNILLALHYQKGDINELKTGSKITSEANINWDKVRSPFEYSFTLKTGEVFAFHNKALAEYGNPKYTMNSRFFGEEGYKFLNGLGGNGVCHLASLMNWVARDANLEVTAKVNHDFWPVPGISREYGTAIFYSDVDNFTAQNQNLYIKNNFDYPVEFKFNVEENKVKLAVKKLS